MTTSLTRFFTVLLGETYDCTIKLGEIVQWRVTTAREFFNSRNKKNELKKKMKHAFSYEQWKGYADTYDAIKDIRIWKESHQTSLYDWEYIKALIDELRQAKNRDDHKLVMLMIRSNAVRNIANILNPALYSMSYVGTKSLIEDFQKEFVDSLGYIANLPEEKLSASKKIDFFSETRHAFGKTALIFSGGANLGFFHFGVLKCLYEENLLPRIVSGSSVGSIVASFLCVKKFDEVKELLHPENVNISAFHKRDNKHSWKRKIQRFIREGVLLDIAVVKDFVRDNIGDITFQEAFDKTGFILNITVTGQGHHDGNRLLNYLTAPHIVIWSAVCASCGLPFIYGPVDLYYKTEEGEIEPYLIGNRKFMDGSIGADLPMQNLSELFNVNYFIVSQTNPWVVPFLNESETQRHMHRTILYKGWEMIKGIVGAELKLRVGQLVSLGILPNAISRYMNLVTQQYGGHITLWPNPTFYDFIHLLDSPTYEWIKSVLGRASLRIYHKVNHIASVLVVERALERQYKAVKNSIMQPAVKRMDYHGDIRGDDDSSEDDDLVEAMKNTPKKTPTKVKSSLRIGQNISVNRLSSVDLLKLVDDERDSD